MGMLRRFSQSVGGAADAEGAAVEDVGVDHRGAESRWPSSSWTVRMS